MDRTEGARYRRGLIPFFLFDLFWMYNIQNEWLTGRENKRIIKGEEREKIPSRKEVQSMKTAEIVKTTRGFYVTLRYYGQNKGREFFAIKTSVAAAEKRAKKFAREWTGE